MDKRLAVLVDADNVAPASAPLVFKEIATFGDATVRRIYGDFSSSNVSNAWTKKVLNNHALVPHHQLANTKGKNSSDIALVIDAMDLLHSGRVDGFVLVSSDSDFTRLASRIREQGLDVIGIGEEKTPESLRKACKRFVFLENLKKAQEASENDAKKDAPKGKESPPKETAQSSTSVLQEHPPTKVVPLVREAMRTVEEEWVTVSIIGSHLHNADPDFDPRTYGCAKLTDLIEKTGEFQVNRKENPVRVRQKKTTKR